VQVFNRPLLSESPPLHGGGYFWTVLQVLPVHDFLALDVPILDVRSPGEFSRAHIPEAISMPLFSDEERAVVGTLYKSEGRDAAMLQGLRYVGPRMAEMVEQARSHCPAGVVRVHCWRGGGRSGSVGWLLSKAGLRASTLSGGYKAFRRHVLESFDAPPAFRVLGGYTGSGKTHVLRALAGEGVRTIDLEALACHKGSAFGALGQGQQPTTEHFENLLWRELSSADASRPVWIEDESLMIGTVRLPQGIYDAIRKAPLFFIEVPLEHRVKRLVQEYGNFDPTLLAEAITRIGRRLGPQHCKDALEALDQGDLETVATIALGYYDKAYSRGLLDRGPSSPAKRIPAGTNDPRELALMLEQHVTTTI
jgi:tRNA 2-selenouridine synthase